MGFLYFKELVSVLILLSIADSRCLPVDGLWIEFAELVGLQPIWREQITIPTLSKTSYLHQRHF